MFTEALYLELTGTGVRAHLLVPGGTVSEFSTPKDDNDPPFPQDPATLAAPEEVAAAVVACIDSDQFVSFATARDADTAAAKAADPNIFLAGMRDRLSALGR
jgi:short-subunit dehydrogenase